jgi:NAD dependent epimerase/dehydratase family enzyme
MKDVDGAERREEGMKALITGATGLIGRRLLGDIENPVVLSRRPGEARRLLGPVEAYLWHPETGSAPSEARRGVEVVFNLAGEAVRKAVGPMKRNAASAIAGSWARATWSLSWPR